MKIIDFIKDQDKRTKFFPYVLMALALVSLVSYSLLVVGFSKLSKKVEASAEEKRQIFTETLISARSALVLDAYTGEVLYEKNADEPLPLASLTKVMTALTAVKTGQNTKYIKITAPDLLSEGDSGLLAGSLWKLQNIIDYSLLVSSNDGASAIAGAIGAFENNSDPENAKKIFVANMNSIAQSIGLQNSTFLNEHGLDRDENHVGAYGSARDMAFLFKYILENHPKLLEATRYPSLQFTDESGFVHNAVNTNISANQIPNLLASKTGFTDLAGGNLVVAFDAGLDRPIIISVLGSTQDDRFDDVLKLASTTLSYIKS